MILELVTDGAVPFRELYDHELDEVHIHGHRATILPQHAPVEMRTQRKHYNVLLELHDRYSLSPRATCKTVLVKYVPYTATLLGHLDAAQWMCLAV